MYFQELIFNQQLSRKFLTNMKNLFLLLIMITGITTSSAQYPTNYDEAKVPVYQFAGSIGV